MFLINRENGFASEDVEKVNNILRLKKLNWRRSFEFLHYCLQGFELENIKFRKNVWLLLSICTHIMGPAEIIFI